ncbi:MAG: serine/threonine protein kinase [Oscillochloris sp.]|nr:serine/threonine protein kinase [Oscillochloris sp.]
MNDGYFCLGIIVLVFGASVLYPLYLGIKAFRAARTQHGETRSTLHILALFMAEPAVNSVLVIALLTLFNTNLQSGIWLGLQLTAPMLVLLYPLRGRSFSDPVLRRSCKTMLVFGFFRWALNVCTFGGIDVGIGLLTVPIGFIVLWASTAWARDTIERLSTPPLPAMPPASSPVVQPTTVAKRITAIAAPIAYPPAPLRPAGSPILCPLCHAITAMYDPECTSCGLVFQSRIPAAIATLAEYRLLRPLGAGGMGHAYLAESQSAHELCVIKTPAGVDVAGPDATASRNLRHEGEMLARIRHPHVVRLLDRGVTSAGDYLVLEFVAGPDLEQLLARHGAGISDPQRLRQILRTGAVIATTLHKLASGPQPLLHLDLKPANLIQSSERDGPVLIDFGNARFATQISHPEATIALNNYGTPGYAAPEQYGGRPTAQSDVYGLAATLYHLISGDDPTSHPLHFPALAHLPTDIATALRPALAHTPAERPPIAIFAATLRTLATQRP